MTNIEKIDLDKSLLQEKLKKIQEEIDPDEMMIKDLKDQIEALESNIYFLQNHAGHKDNSKIFVIQDKNVEIYKLAEQASIIGDTVGDPLKDTSGPSLNILIKLSSIISVVFGSLFVSTSFLKSWT